MIDLNVTFVIQLVNFIIALFLVNTFLIRPVRDILARRKEASAALNEQIDGFVAQAASKLADYEALLRSARDEANSIRNDEREDALAAQVAILAAASRDAAEEIRLAQQKTAEEKKQAEDILAQRIQPLADEAARKFMV